MLLAGGICRTGGRDGKGQCETTGARIRGHGSRCDIDAVVTCLYYEEGEWHIINQYIAFCKVFRDVVRNMGRTTESIQEILRICRDKNILAEYIYAMESEIMDIINTSFVSA